MPWTTPKTNWRIQPRDAYGRYNGDWFNISPDYARIKGNLEFLAERVGWFFSEVTEFVSPPALTTGSLVYFDDLNIIESDIAAINKHLPKPLILSGSKVWAGNGQSPTVDDLNRIESCCLYLYNAIIEQSIFVWKLPFNMAGRRF